MLDTIISFVLQNIIQPWPIIITLLFISVYQPIKRNRFYFTHQNVKFTRVPPFISSMWRSALGKKSIAEDILDLYNEWPNEKLFGTFEIGSKPVYFIRDPELIKQIGIKDFDHFVNHENFFDGDSDPMFGRSLFFMNDQRWKNMRATLSPAFTGSKMRLMFSLIGDVSQQFGSYLKNDIKNGTGEFQMTELFARFANDAIASTAFGIDVNSLKDRDNEFYKTGLSISNFTGIENLWKFLIIFTAPKFITKLLKIRITKEKDTNYFRKIVYENMKYREKNGILRNDMINILMQVKKGMQINEESSEPQNDMDGFANVQDSTQGKFVNNGQKWTDDDLSSQCMLFFLAGFQTVSLTLCFMAHELTVNPDVQERLYQEILETKKSLNGKPLTYEALQKMKYMDMVLSESMRMWSLVSIINRLVNKSYTIENGNGTQVHLEVGDTVAIPIHGIHRDPKWFPNPNKFVPERFSDDNKGNIVPGTYMPFGIGPRSCIASRFALMECKACMFYIMSDYSLEIGPKFQQTIILKKNTGTLEVENGFWITLKPRN